MSTSLESKIAALQERARMLAHVRAFFAEREVMEVDTPILSHTAPIATHIDVMEVAVSPGEIGYLHTSPEFAMKRLLASGIGDIYQLSHVFRAGEAGRLHNPEFTMIEWYRVGVSLQFLINETVSLIRLFLGDIPFQSYTYAEAFKKFLGIDYQKSTLEELKNLADFECEDKDTCLHYLMAFHLEPQLKGLTILRDFPASQAALAQTYQTSEGLVAKRFEIYFNGIELANGFHELTDPIEQRRRFIEDNFERQKRGKIALPIDEHFLAALETGLPDSCGVAVGFDRLLMLMLKKETLSEVLPFSWDAI